MHIFKLTSWAFVIRWTFPYFPHILPNKPRCGKFQSQLGRLGDIWPLGQHLCGSLDSSHRIVRQRQPLQVPCTASSKTRKKMKGPFVSYKEETLYQSYLLSPTADSRVSSCWLVLAHSLHSRFSLAGKASVWYL